MGMIPLLLGAVAVFSPMVGLLLAFVYCGSGERVREATPLQRIGLIFLPPVLFLLLTRQQSGTSLLVADAICGVGLVALVFLVSRFRGLRPEAALANAAILVICYGIVRHIVFAGYLQTAYEQSLSQLQRSFPQLLQNSVSAGSMSLIRDLQSGAWMATQLLVLGLGYILYQRLSGQKFLWNKFFLPRYYNLFLLALLPMYLFPQFRLLLLNVLIALCVLPLLQGIAVLSSLSARYAANPLLLVLGVVLIIFNLILVALLGFTDIWLDFRNINSKGSYS